MMTLFASPRTQAARTLTGALLRETELARTGALAELAAAAEAKQAAFQDFQQACPEPAAPPTAAERDAFAALLTASRENALVLEAVVGTLSDFADNLRNLLRSAADPGTYTPGPRQPRHVLAARLNACA
jgi:hypothetical protein